MAAVVGLLALAAIACQGDKLVEAYDNFVGFSKGEENVIDPQRKNKKPYQLRSWKGEHAGSRFRALAEVSVAPGIDRKSLEEVLRNAVHDPAIHRKTAVIMVRAWPGKLERLSAPLGAGVFARDGHGWDGRGVGFEEIHLFLPTKRQAAEGGLQPLTEKELLMVLGVENVLGRGHPLKQAQQQAAEFQGVELEAVQKACLRAAKLAKWRRALARKEFPTALKPLATAND
jgi:hypothetical protein